MLSEYVLSRMDQSLLTLQVRESPFQNAMTPASHLSVDRSHLVSLYR